MGFLDYLNLDILDPNKAKTQQDWDIIENATTANGTWEQIKPLYETWLNAQTQPKGPGVGPNYEGDVGGIGYGGDVWHSVVDLSDPLNPTGNKLPGAGPKTTTPPFDPNTLWGMAIRNYYRPGGAGYDTYQYSDDNTYILKRVNEWNNDPNNMPTTPEGMAAKLGLVWTPPKAETTPAGDDVPYVMTPFGGRTAYQSGFDPSLYAFDANLAKQKNAAALEQARLAALPGVQEALAGAREDAARAGGGEATGMFNEFSRKPLEEFSRNLGVKALDLEQQSLADQEALAKEARTAKAADTAAKAQWEMEQDVKEHDWIRGETAKLFGAEYAQNLSDKEWERNNKAQVAKDNIELAFRNGEINREEAWKRWSAVNDERIRLLNEQRADLEWQRQVAQQNNLFDKEAALTREIKAIDREIANQQSDAAEDAAMWSGIGSLTGSGIGAFAAFSDRRLKQNIKRIGTHLLGIGIYEFNYLWDKGKRIGVMADEVKKVMPKAVIRHSNGYDMVDYGMLSEVK